MAVCARLQGKQVFRSMFCAEADCPAPVSAGKVLPAYEPDDGPLTAAQLSTLRKLANAALPVGKVQLSLPFLFSSGGPDPRRALFGTKDLENCAFDRSRARAREHGTRPTTLLARVPSSRDREDRSD